MVTAEQLRQLSDQALKRRSCPAPDPQSHRTAAEIACRVSSGVQLRLHFLRRDTLTQPKPRHGNGTPIGIILAAGVLRLQQPFPPRC